MLVQPDWVAERPPLPDGSGFSRQQHGTANMPRAGSIDPALPRVDLSLFWKIIVRRRALLVLTTTIALVSALGYLAVAPARFSASALLLIDTKSNTVFRAAPAVNDAAVESANIESQVEILKSERLLQKVVEDQKLRDAPVLAPGALSRAFGALSGKLFFWRKPTALGRSQDPELIAAARALAKLVSVKRVGTTYLIEISATMASPEQAANVANSVAENYTSDQQRFREDLSRRQSHMLQARSDELQSHVRRAEEAVEQLKFSGSMKGETSAAARVELKDLESSAQAYRLLHDKFLEQSAESWQQQFLTLPDATVASPAYPPLSKSSPQTLIVLACSLLLGLSSGVILVLLLERKVLGGVVSTTHA